MEALATFAGSVGDPPAVSPTPRTRTELCKLFVGNIDPSKNPRADSFSLYMHTVGEVLLKNLLPKKKIASLPHKEVANPYLKAATYEQVMKDKSITKSGKKPLLQQISNKKERTSSTAAQAAVGSVNNSKI